MTDRQPEGIVHEATDRIRETVDEIKPKLRGWLHAITLPLAFFAFIVTGFLAVAPKLAQ